VPDDAVTPPDDEVSALPPPPPPHVQRIRTIKTTIEHLMISNNGKCLSIFLLPDRNKNCCNQTRDDFPAT